MLFRPLILSIMRAVSACSKHFVRHGLRFLALRMDNCIILSRSAGLRVPMRLFPLRYYLSAAPTMGEVS